MDGDGLIKPVDHPSHGTEATRHGVRFEDGCLLRPPQTVGAGWAVDGTPARLSWPRLSVEGHSADTAPQANDWLLTAAASPRCVLLMEGC